MTEILKVDPINPEINIIRKAADIIRKGGLVVFPTETVYGLGADAFNENAVRKVFEAKNRPLGNPLIVHLADKSQVELVAKDIPDEVYEIADKVWPGPLTLILMKRENVPKIVTGGLSTVAVRIPAHPVALSLIKEAGRPIVGPSANISGRPSPTRPEHVIKDLFNRVDIILDAGETFHGVESTIIDLTKDPPALIRPGPITIEDLRELLGRDVLVPPEIHGKISERTEFTTPSFRYPRYVPKTKLVLVEGELNDVIRIVSSLAKKAIAKGKKVALIVSDETKECYKDIKGDLFVVGSRKNLFSIAKNLFNILRRVEDANVDLAIAEGYDLKGIGFTIMNRLRNAAHEIVKPD